MMRIMILFLSLLCESVKKRHKIRLKILGVDERYPIVQVKTDVVNHFMNYKYLRFLENPDVSILHKKKVAEKVIGQNIQPIDITAGGLLDDWQQL